ncbi:hypothetical protein BK242_24120 [Escherichia coli]|nr:hypothetical protein BK242_24120 [Escherichia coli]
MRTDTRQRITLTVKLCGGFTDTVFQPSFIMRQITGINTRLTQFLTLALYRQSQAVIFRL